MKFLCKSGAWEPVVVTLRVKGGRQAPWGNQCEELVHLFSHLAMKFEKQLYSVSSHSEVMSRQRRRHSSIVLFILELAVKAQG